MANTITGVNDEVVSQAALEQFTALLAPLSAFSTDFSGDAAAPGDTIKVPVVENQTAIPFAGNYETGDADATGISVLLDKHDFKSNGVTDTEFHNSSFVQAERFGFQAGAAVAKLVSNTILAVVTAANFGTAGFTGVASTFTGDDVVDLRTALTNKLAGDPRNLVLGPDYFGALLKDTGINHADAFGGSEAVRAAMIPGLYGFQNVIEATQIPANAENLVGFAAHPASIAVAMRYLSPQQDAAAEYLDTRQVTDPGTGITLGYRRWYSTVNGKMWITLEANYGFVVTGIDGISRIVSV
jgi:hypothetical protein